MKKGNQGYAVALAASLLLALCALPTKAQQTELWPDVKAEARPGARWWWLGSAVDKENLEWSIRTYAEAGLGELEITPIYGVQGNEENDIPFLSPRWMEMLRFCYDVADEVGIRIDMSTGTGWPFGGPWVSDDDAACKAVFGKDDSGKTTFEVGRTRQKVKRAAPGGEGWVVDHYNADAVRRYLAHIAEAFKQTGTPAPHNFFNDSYEVYGADWTPDFLHQFAKRRGYRLEEHWEEFLHPEADTAHRIVSDYRETLGELLNERFARQWTSWAHRQGSITRGQAHGSPSNLIDTYAAYDIPECEGFGLSPFGIKGLRVDSIRKKNDADFTVLKYASSAAHISGKPLVSSETFTWLTEHFRTSLSQCKPDMDLMFVTGVNHMFFHGTCYSPKDDAWPGWKFYASMDMSPTNTIWRDAPAFFQYITRCQSFLQMGKPDNDFLVYLPIYDVWHEQPGRYLMFDIHKMREKAPRFIEAVNTICESGYDVDYISDAFLLQTKVKDGKLVTPGKAAYKAIIVPGARLMPAETLAQLEKFARQGAKVVFIGGLPEDVPGYGHYAKRHKAFEKTLAKIQQAPILIGEDYDATLEQCGVRYESMRRAWCGLRAIRRMNDTGYHYFISNLQDHDVEYVVTLGVDCADALFFDPLTGRVGRPMMNGSKLLIQLKSGESIILQTFNEPLQAEVEDWQYAHPQNISLALDHGWSLRFEESTPAVSRTFRIDNPQSWTEKLPSVCPELAVNMGTGIYETTFSLPEMEASEWILDLGDVRESARVYVNGTYAGTAWCVPFQLRVGSLLKKGENTLRVEVTNLPANRIAQMDREGVQWRKFKDINVADLNYKNTRYDTWAPVPSGLNSSVKLIPCDVETMTSMEEKTKADSNLRLQ
ncbi:MAG: glycosyl hydrolase family 2 [Bacteroidaceae bacterium]|nr:glycosyl hydrolase family 2 [Bacteroidaceae bacterium]